MIELKGLEDWARGILATPISTLNRRFGSWKKEGELRKLIEELPFFSRYRPIFRQISAPTLHDLHQKLRGQKCEDLFWDILLELLEHPLPDEIAFDLIERGISTGWLAHSPQSEAVYWRLVPDHSDAILTLAKQSYTGSSRTLEEFQHVLNSEAADPDWVLPFVADWPASSPEKRAAFEKAVGDHPKRETWLKANPNINPDYKPLIYYDLNRLSYTEGVEALYGPYDLNGLLEVARNDQTPDVILRELEALRSFPGSAQIRAAARHTLRRREEGFADSSQ